MKIKKSAAVLYLSVFIVFLYIVAGILNSGDMLSVIETAVLSVPLMVYIYYIDLESIRTKALVLSLAVFLFVVITLFDSFLVDKAPFLPSLIRGISSSFFLLPLTVITFNDTKKNSLKALMISSLYAAVTLPALRETVNTYFFIYMDVIDYPSFLTWATATAISLILTSLSELVFRTKKNYLSDFFLLSSVIFSYLAQKAKGDATPIFSSLPIIILMIFFIYISREEKVAYSTERRTIVLSTLKIQEIEHLRKKKKPRVYEIPPNVPVNDIRDDGK